MTPSNRLRADGVGWWVGGDVRFNSSGSDLDLFLGVPYIPVEGHALAQDVWDNVSRTSAIKQCCGRPFATLMNGSNLAAARHCRSGKPYSPLCRCTRHQACCQKRARRRRSAKQRRGTAAGIWRGTGRTAPDITPEKNDASAAGSGTLVPSL